MQTGAQRARAGLALLLAVAAALAAVAGASAWIVRDALVSPDGFADRAERALDEPAVSDAIADEIAAQVAAELPGGVVPEERIAAAISEGVHTPAFAREVRANARELNGVLFGGETATATLDVDISGALDQADPELAALLPGPREARLIAVGPDDLPLDTARGGDLIRVLAAVLLPAACFALALALIVAPVRRRVFAWFGATAVVAGALLLVVTFVGRAAAQDRARGGSGLSGAEARDAVGAIWDVYGGSLRTVAIVALAGGLVLAIGAFAASRGAQR